MDLHGGESPKGGSYYTQGERDGAGVLPFSEKGIKVVRERIESRFVEMEKLTHHTGLLTTSFVTSINKTTTALTHKLCPVGRCSLRRSCGRSRPYIKQLLHVRGVSCATAVHGVPFTRSRR